MTAGMSNFSDQKIDFSQFSYIKDIAFKVYSPFHFIFDI